MDFLETEIAEYVTSHTEPEPPILQELNRETWLKVLNPRMLSGHLQGRVLSILSHMMSPQNILEIGTYTGYSAICLSEGLAENGKITTIDINEELYDMACRYFEKAGIRKKVNFLVGNALDLIPDLKEEFDLVFIDADKGNYCNYYDLVIDRLKPGGYIIADNVLWSGKILENYDDLDLDTKTLIDFNNKIQQDGRVQNVLFPVRDGLQVIRKL